MDKTRLKVIVLLQFILLINFNIISQNNTCSTALKVDIGTHEIMKFSEGGSLFEGATAAAWYRYEPTEKGIFTVSSCGEVTNTRLVLFLLDDCANPEDLILLNSAEDNCIDGLGGSTASVIESVAVPGFSYVIYWDNAQSSDGFNWELSFVKDQEIKEGESCETAKIITEGEHQVDSLTGVGSAFLDAVSAQWYVFIPQENSLLNVSSCESAVNTRLFIWSDGCEFSNILSQNDDGCQNDGASEIKNIPIVAGHTYYIYWDDHWSKQGFNFKLSLTDSSVATNEPLWAKGIEVFPNPADDFINVSYALPTPKDFNIRIFDSIGQLVHAEQWRSFHKGNYKLSVNKLNNGIYFLQMTSQFERITRPILIK